jgi:hypothetical protein
MMLNSPFSIAVVRQPLVTVISLKDHPNQVLVMEVLCNTVTEPNSRSGESRAQETELIDDRGVRMSDSEAK